MDPITAITILCDVQHLQKPTLETEQKGGEPHAPTWKQEWRWCHTSNVPGRDYAICTGEGATKSEAKRAAYSTLARYIRLELHRAYELEHLNSVTRNLSSIETRSILNDNCPSRDSSLRCLCIDRHVTSTIRNGHNTFEPCACSECISLICCSEQDDLFIQLHKTYEKIMKRAGKLTEAYDVKGFKRAYEQHFGHPSRRCDKFCLAITDCECLNHTLPSEQDTPVHTCDSH